MIFVKYLNTTSSIDDMNVMNTGNEAYIQWRDWMRFRSASLIENGLRSDDVSFLFTFRVNF